MTVNTIIKTLFILNAPTGGSELTYKGLRLANMLAKQEHHEASAFMMDDAVGAAKQGRKVAEGFAKPKSMHEGFAQGDASRVGVCVGYPEARGI